LLDIYIGPEQRRWSLHERLLCYHSSFFDEGFTLNGEHKRIKDGELYMPDQDPAAFELLIKWLYQGKIEDVSWKPKDVKWDYAFTCQKLYLLSEVIGLTELKNRAIDEFRKGCNEARLVPGGEEMEPIYAKTAAGSPFRKLVSKIAARQIMDPDTRRDANIYRSCFEAHPDFAVDVINEIRDNTGGFLFDDPNEGNSCRYHEHEGFDTCHKTVKFENGTKGPR
jgi:hypothetical protein